MRRLILASSILLWSAAPAYAQVSVGIGLPGVSIGINMRSYPDLVRVPGYPVYYDPQVDSNYFFYDGQYWAYEQDNWYAASWYNGPWELVGPEYVPLFLLRVPVRYYRQPPAYFRGWSANASPRWGDHWGSDWQQRRSGWDTWNRNSVPAAAPLPTYQRQYSGARYPGVTQQQSIRSTNYRYQPREAITQQRPAQQSTTEGSRVNTQRQMPTQQPARAPAPAQAQVESARVQPQTRSQQQAHTQQAPTYAQPLAHTGQQAHVEQQAHAQPQERAQPQQAHEQQQTRAQPERAQPQQAHAQQQASPQQRSPVAQEHAQNQQRPQAAQKEAGREAKAAPQGKGGDSKDEGHNRDRR
jgi:hypothetical protein